jgi:hypothetical protein
MLWYWWCKSELCFELLTVLYISPNDYSTSQQLLADYQTQGEHCWLKQFLVDKQKLLKTD